MTSSKLARAVHAIEQHGVLLVYPLQNRKDPLSLWHVLHPRSEMRWSWDDSADPRVAELWHLRAALASSRKVVYGKFLGGRATLFSRSLFQAMLATLRGVHAEDGLRGGLAPGAALLLELLYEDSPRPTRALREAAGLEGRAFESEFTRAMRALWQRLLIVGAGEVEEGGFPSLAVGASELLFEPLWNAADELRSEDRQLLDAVQRRSPAFARAWRKASAPPI